LGLVEVCYFVHIRDIDFFLFHDDQSLVSQLLSAALALFVLSRHVPFHFDSLGWIVKPLAALSVSVGIMLFFRSCLLYIPWKILPVLEMFLSILILCAVYIGIMFFSQIYILLRGRGIIKA
jgi:hypothetical protein